MTTPAPPSGLGCVVNFNLGTSSRHVRDILVTTTASLLASRALECFGSITVAAASLGVGLAIPIGRLKPVAG